MTDEQIAWCAALFEGEGSISIKQRGASPLVDLRLGMTDRDVVERFHTYVGVGHVFSTRSPSLPTHCQTRYQWAATKRDDVLALLESFRPWFGARRTARAEEAIAVLAEFFRVCYCGKEFMQRRPEQVFCSRKCKSIGRIFR